MVLGVVVNLGAREQPTNTPGDYVILLHLELELVWLQEYPHSKYIDKYKKPRDYDSVFLASRDIGCMSEH